MTYIVYDAVVKLAEQLSPEEQQALIEHLQGIAKQRQLNFDEWGVLLDSIKFNVSPGAEFSDRRADWYGDDGR